MKVASVLARWILSSAEPAPSFQSPVVSSVVLPSTPSPSPLRLLLSLAAMRDMFTTLTAIFTIKVSWINLWLRRDSMGLILCANEKAFSIALSWVLLSILYFHHVVFASAFSFFFFSRSARFLELLPFGGLSISAVHSFSANLTMFHDCFKSVCKAECLVFFEALYVFERKKKELKRQQYLCRSFFGNFPLVKLAWPAMMAELHNCPYIPCFFGPLHSIHSF